MSLLTGDVKTRLNNPDLRIFPAATQFCAQPPQNSRSVCRVAFRANRAILRTSSSKIVCNDAAISMCALESGSFLFLGATERCRAKASIAWLIEVGVKLTWRVNRSAPLASDGAKSLSFWTNVGSPKGASPITLYSEPKLSKPR